MPSDGTKLGGAFDVDTFELKVLGDQLIGMENVPIIHGACSGINVTLTNCHHLKVNGRGLTVHGQSITATSFLVGENLVSTPRPTFTEASWRFPGLEAWASRYPFDNDTPGERSITHSFAAAAELFSGGGSVLTLEQITRTSGGFFSYSFESRTDERIKLVVSDALPLSEIYWNWLVPTSRFFSLVMGQSITHREWRVRRANGEWLDVHMPSDCSRERNDSRARRAVLPFDPKRTPAQLGTWMSKHGNI